PRRAGGGGPGADPAAPERSGTWRPRPEVRAVHRRSVQRRASVGNGRFRPARPRPRGSRGGLARALAAPSRRPARDHFRLPGPAAPLPGRARLLLPRPPPRRRPRRRPPHCHRPSRPPRPPPTHRLPRPIRNPLRRRLGFGGDSGTPYETRGATVTRRRTRDRSRPPRGALARSFVWCPRISGAGEGAEEGGPEGGLARGEI